MHWTTASSKLGSQPCDCRWPLRSSSGVYVGMYDRSQMVQCSELVSQGHEISVCDPEVMVYGMHCPSV